MKRLSIGTYKKLPHYSVIGERVDFYVWVNKDARGSSSKWIKGKEAFDLWAKLHILHKKGKGEFVQLVKKIHKDNRKQF